MTKRVHHKQNGVFLINGSTLPDGESSSKIFWTSHYRTIGHTGGTFKVGKYHHCIGRLPGCQNTEGWDDCGLWWNTTWNAQNLEQRSTLAYSCVSSGLVFWKGTERLANLVIIPIHKKGDRRKYTNYMGICLASLEKCLSSAFKKDAAKYFNLSWRIASAVFVLAVAIQTKFSFYGTFFRHLGSISFKSVFVPILTYGYESGIMTERALCQVQEAQMGFLWRVHGVTFREKVRSCEIFKTLNVGPLHWIERSQLRWFDHVVRMSHEKFARHVLLAPPTKESTRVRPRTRWNDYISDLVWSSLSVEWTEPSEIAENHEVFWVLLGLLQPRPSPVEKRVWTWCNEWMVQC